jgi:hypothetical protein
MRTLVSFLALFVTACATGRPHVRIPERLRVQPGSPASAPYVVKLVDGTRQWEIAVPEVDGGYEVRIPLGDGSPLVPGAAPVKTDAAKASAAGAPSATDRPAAYVSALALIDALYARQSYDVALREVNSLLAAYADDTRLLAMAGTLSLKLNDPAAAQAAWQRVLELDPGNETVLAALEALP